MTNMHAKKPMHGIRRSAVTLLSAVTAARRFASGAFDRPVVVIDNLLPAARWTDRNGLDRVRATALLRQAASPRLKRLTSPDQRRQMQNGGPGSVRCRASSWPPARLVEVAAASATETLSVA